MTIVSVSGAYPEPDNQGGDSKLSGDWGNVWECHVEPGRILIYDVTDEAVLLIRTGTHGPSFFES